MSGVFSAWLLGVLTSSGLTGVALVLMRESLTRYFTRTIEHRFEKRLESFKGDIRDNEKELEQIRSFLVSAKMERDALLQSKRLQAAESLLHARQALSQFSMLVEYMTIFNVKKMLESGANVKIQQFVEGLVQPLDIDNKLSQLQQVERAIARLYLSENTIKAFDAYESIIFHAIMTTKLLTVPFNDKGGLIKEGSLSSKVIELVPASKEGFEKFGERYAFYWSTYFYDQVLVSLRHEVSGVDDAQRDYRSIEKLAADSRQAQINVRASLEKVKLPEELIDVSIPTMP